MPTRHDETLTLTAAPITLTDVSWERGNTRAVTHDLSAAEGVAEWLVEHGFKQIDGTEISPGQYRFVYCNFSNQGRIMDLSDGSLIEIIYTAPKPLGRWSDRIYRPSVEVAGLQQGYMLRHAPYCYVDVDSADDAYLQSLAAHDGDVTKVAIRYTLNY